MTIVQEQIAHLFHTISHTPVVSGRVLLTRCIGRGTMLSTINCHMPNTSDGAPLYRRILGDICRALPPATASFNLIAGDWDFAFEE
eukprot:2726512-Pyramimonas_sp.AAC.1